MIPSTRTEWSFERVQLLADAGQSEGDRHDFKLNLPDAKNLTKVACAFANSYGGFFIIGVSERNGHHFMIEGIDPDKELFGKFIDKVRCTPSIAIEPPISVPIPHTSKFVYIFEVGRSFRRPHLPISETDRVFWKREGSSCKQMSLEEIRDQILHYEEKREKLQLVLIDLHNKLTSIGHQASLTGGAYTGEIFSFDIIDSSIVSSFSLIKDYNQIFQALQSIRATIWNLNSQKQILLNFLALSYTQEDKLSKINQYTAFAQSSYGFVQTGLALIEHILLNELDIKNPFKQV
jgi:Putative DNA-binding domain